MNQEPSGNQNEETAIREFRISLAYRMKLAKHWRSFGLLKRNMSYFHLITTAEGIQKNSFVHRA
jgi:ethanolamine utilization microcompartment shell protein EutL